MRRLLLLPILLLCSLLLSGCYSLKMLSTEAVQKAPGSPEVTITMRACIAGNQAGENTDQCSPDEPAPADPEDDTLLRYVVSVLVPQGSTTPPSLTSAAGRPLTFERNTQVEHVMEGGMAVPGFAWRAWTTAGVLEFTPSPDEFTVAIPVTLPVGADSLPAMQTMHYRGAIVAALADNEDTPTDQIACYEQTGLLLIGGLPCVGEGHEVMREIVIDRSVPATVTGTDLCANLAGEQTSLLIDEQRTSAGDCVSTRIGSQTSPNRLPGTRLGDYMYGGGKADVMRGGAGADVMTANAGGDVVDGGPGNDMLIANAGNDKVIGGAGSDLMSGDAGNDVLAGGLGNDRMEGGAGADRVAGDAGNDQVKGGDGRDTLLGGAGNDRLDANDEARGDTVNGGPGRDTCIINPGDRAISCERIIRKPLKKASSTGKSADPLQAAIARALAARGL
jgi:hypothetical protein